MAGVQRQVGCRDPCADHGGQVDDDVDPVEQSGPLQGVAGVEPMDSLGWLCPSGGAVRLGQQHVDGDDVDVAALQLGCGGRADEPGSTGEEDSHVASVVAGARAQPGAEPDFRLS